jgi:hypothetical protein
VCNARFDKAVMHSSNSSTASIAISSAMHDRSPGSHGCPEGTANATPRRATGAALTMHAAQDGVCIARNDRSATSYGCKIGSHRAQPNLHPTLVPLLLSPFTPTQKTHALYCHHPRETSFLHPRNIPLWN